MNGKKWKMASERCVERKKITLGTMGSPFTATEFLELDEVCIVRCERREVVTRNFSPSSY